MSDSPSSSGDAAVDRHPEDEAHEGEDEEELHEGEHQVGQELPQHHGERRGRGDHELLERPALALADDGVGREQRPREGEEDGDEARDQQVGAPRVGVEEEGRVRLEREVADPHLVAHRGERAVEGDAVGGPQGLRRDRRVRAVDQHQEARRLPVELAAGEVGRDLDADRGAAGDDLAAQRGARRHVADDVEVAGVDEVGDQLAARRGAALVEDHGRHVADVGVDQAEEDELEDRHHEGEAQRPAVAEHLDRLLLEDGAEAPHRRASVPGCAGAGLPGASPLPFDCSAGQAHEDVLERGGDRAHVDGRVRRRFEVARDLARRSSRRRPAGGGRCRRSSPPGRRAGSACGSSPPPPPARTPPRPAACRAASPRRAG